MLKYISIFFFGIVIITNGLAIDNNAMNMKYGFFGEYGFDQNKADFNKLQDIPNCCPIFKDGSGNGITIGGFLDMPFDSKYGLLLRGSYTSLYGKMLNIEPTKLIYFDSIAAPTGSLKDGSFEHLLNGSFTKIGLDPIFYYNVTSAFKVNVGMRLAFSMSSKYDQKETVLGTYGSFTDSTEKDLGRVRNKSEGDIPNAAAFSLYALAGLSYDLPMNKMQSLFLMPTAYYYYNLNSVVNKLDWSIHSLRLGLALKYSPTSFAYKIEEKRKIDTVYLENTKYNTITYLEGVETSKKETKTTDNLESTIVYYNRTDTIITPKQFALKGSVEAVGVDSLGNEKKVVQFTIEEFISNRMQPLLPYIFFEDNSDVIANKYLTATQGNPKDFVLKGLAKTTTMETYYQILNIVGRRMTDNPSAKLRIVGCTSNIGVEQNNKDLSLKRATNVRDYLKKVWDLDDTRLSIENRLLPENPSTPVTELEKIAENRRVEFYSNVYEILAPISLNDTLRISNPPIARFKLYSQADAGVKSWELTAQQKNSPSINFQSNGISSPPAKIDWALNANQKSMPTQDEQILVDLKLIDNKEKIVNVSSNIPINYLSISKKRKEKILDKEINRYNLMLFEFNKYEIKSNNLKIVELIKANMQENSVVTITGYTDKTGDVQYNQKLSQNRASATKDALNHKNTNYTGKGGTILLFNNDLPEGRFYCRTVDILVETEVK